MLISIITVCLNNKSGLRRTLASIADQDHRLYESLVIDGGSSDGSPDLIETSSVIDHYLIESDDGIYQAMNKGVQLARGEYVIFMNSGDVFFSPDVIGKIALKIRECNPSFIYGAVFSEHKGGLRKDGGGELINMWKRMPFSHQTLFAKRSLCLASPFDENKKLAADFKFIYGAYCDGHEFINSGLNVAIVEQGGISETHRLLSIRERYASVKEVGNHLALEVHLFYLYHLVRCAVMRPVRKAIDFFSRDSSGRRR